jgi:hypothetical protein
MTLYIPQDRPIVDPRTGAIDFGWLNFLTNLATGAGGVSWTNIDFTSSSLADLLTVSASSLNTGTVPLARISGLTNTNVASGAGIAYSKLNLGSSIVNGDVSNSANIATSKLLNVTASTYTPTLTNVSNLDASTAYQAQYLRIDNTVTVSGRVDVNPTAGASTQLGISLPLGSNIGATEDVGGVAFASGIAGQGAAIRGDAVNDRAEMVWVAVDLTNQPMYFTFSYRII